ncbi:hypothetical protein CC86DRAFT_381282 [Ophiobolus disseminans]|uniref:Uncharacterized protein n=1 Tax=Ophiobolus disseminans TaxID=1469910 RepID=A0A6A7A280_9PLEO|nr:hypothetical protein CC86DRAFT_381282 [Ophiobolus disseminans]
MGTNQNASAGASVDSSTTTLSDPANDEPTISLSCPTAGKTTRSNGIKAVNVEPKVRTVESLDTGPKVRHIAEFRSHTNGTLLYANTITEDDGTTRRVVHQGPVFDVVDINYTAETKDTQKKEGPAGKTGGATGMGSSPSVDFRG